jgi:hypothetical protein
MTNLKEIISETIHSYLSENLITENGFFESSKKHKEKKFRKRAIKKRGGLRGDLDMDDYRKENQKADDQELSDIEEWLKSDAVNLTAIARKLYPHLSSDESRESKLRKKVYHEASDSGYVYKLSRQEVKKLKQIKNSYI